MKTLLGSAGNVLAGPDGDGWYEPLCEVVLILSEPRYEADATGFVKRHQVSDVRFGGTPKSLRKLAEQLNRLADESEGELLRFIQACRVPSKAEGGEG